MKRSKHSLSSYKLTTMDMGNLVPVGLFEVLPGDTFQHQASALIRVSPLVAPVMHPVTVRIHHWYVPNRIVWSGWEDFITGGKDGTDSQTIPTVSTTSDPKNNAKLLDYLGVPPVADKNVNALPVRAYNMIYNEFYRDQDLSVARNPDELNVRNIAWEKDYFTSARPWPQKGPDVTIPIGGVAPVTATGDMTPTFDYPSQTDSALQTVTSQLSVNLAKGVASGVGQLKWNDPKLEANLAQAQAVSISEFRRAFALQRYQEARAQYGSRFTEYLRYLGITPADARLQRPEYLGGGKQTIAFSEVLQTADDTTNQNPLGRLGGHGISAMRSRRYRRFFQEHGYVLTLMSVRPKSMYASGLSRHWLKTDKFDYWQKELQQIGQQPVYNGEIRFSHATSEGTFGWQDRYAEYKHQKSSVSAEFRDQLNYWHLARDFSSDPALNDAFIRCQPSKRIHAVQTNDVLWVMVNHSIQARRLVRRGSGSRIL